MPILRKIIFNKVTRKDEEWVKITKKETDLLSYIREELPFGKGFLITHAGEPQRIEDPKKIKFFGNGNGVDKCFGKQV